MFAGKFHQTSLGTLALIVVLMLTPPLLRAQPSAPPTQTPATAGTLVTNQAPRQIYVPPSNQPIPTATKRKAGFLAGAGLAILSLLALAAGLALVRTFKR